jgi:hypothetical protein
VSRRSESLGVLGSAQPVEQREEHERDKTSRMRPALSVKISQGTITYRIAGPAVSKVPVVVFVHGLLVDGNVVAACPCG